MTKFLGTYICDKGSAVVNGVCFSNGIGDGEYDILFASAKPENVKTLAWVDLRDGVDVLKVWKFDCRPESEQSFSGADFDDAQAVEFGFDDAGNLVFWKLF